MDGPADDQWAPLPSHHQRFQEMLAGLDADHWDAPSRCDGWAVRDVVAHLVGVNSFWANQ